MVCLFIKLTGKLFYIIFHWYWTQLKVRHITELTLISVGSVCRIRVNLVIGFGIEL